jgi:hypothetical protein
MHYIPLSFIVNFSNLQELKLSFNLEECFVDFEELQDVIFPKLQVLKIRDEFPDDGSLERFIENNGKSLKEISIGEIDDLLNLTIANFCPMLRKLPLELKIIIWEC